MFTLNRRSLAGIAAVAAVGAGLGAGAATTPPADAATGCYWKIPSRFELEQSNGWSVQTTRRIAKYTWAATANHGEDYIYGKLKLTRFDTSGNRPQVRFTIVWSNNSGGAYKGTIDEDGYITGTATDKVNPRATARFTVIESVDCV